MWRLWNIGDVSKSLSDAFQHVAEERREGSRYSTIDREVRIDVSKEAVASCGRDELAHVATILHTSPKISAEQELMNDFMSLIASFSGKFYRLRGYTQQKQLLTQAEHNIDQKMQEKEG